MHGFNIVTFSDMSQFIPSSHKSKKTGEVSNQLVDENKYVYNKKRTNKDTIVWSCVQKDLRKCKVTVKTGLEVSYFLASTSHLVDAKNQH